MRYMVQKKRSEGQTAVSLSIEKDLLADIDNRAASLGLSRSLYLATLARQDIKHGGELIIPAPRPEHSPSYPPHRPTAHSMNEQPAVQKKHKSGKARKATGSKNSRFETVEGSSSSDEN